ncbi:hypothetical protein GobsT_19740 [Gemmata obscuriglobus]|uniref:DUF1080 domain-containing protein n=1 Tax=Gemmata obscuriglobus TaxID=114 RepID=A0A2Z3H0Y4_9BACT|nr:DUF1080 domain-containing protein [Gemmata obscuriglobus]AWM39673.1 DUF1080 domain-containing protein [Gemmata obscuriglobus]QEG27220.1 hypothetical protein GobsT_19740 [Gemmata obscuriglobus]VTS03954.1 Secreted glycosyl hydrolase OS=uncultured planctomycete GN=HGMM_F11G08C09 PE=4 SV=1: DUF1080 [Gemmata obscuriglobus UQM 2246]
MFRLLTALALLASASPAFAADADQPKPNTLTTKEIADGWVLLFDGETNFGWKIEGAAEVKDGVLILGKGKKTIAHPSATFPHFETHIEWQGKGIAHTGTYQLTIDGPTAGNDTNRWAGLHLQRDRRPGMGYAGYEVSGGLCSDKQVKEPRPEATTAPVLIETDGKNEVRIRTAKLRPDHATLLFNGKNLDGWKVNTADPKRAASKWAVTKDGELSVKNGPGDLVTEKEFDNFVLQFECKTLGKALNSGIFFRCIPGQYQNGYEAQVQNAYKDGDRTKPADFGTGAIYRRIAARKVVSNDNEWFTMTVAANGRRISTWVNGYQTVDWLDERKESDNPRQGFRAAKGPLSIQGHDPTTDILFRNIRIATLP